MARKGGGRAGFMRSAMRSKAQEAEAEAAAEAGRERVEGSAPEERGAEADDAEGVTRSLADASLAGEAGPGPSAVAAASAGEDEEGEGGASEALESRGKMTQRHKREMKAVRDKGKRLGKKGKEEAARLEAETAARHAAELAELDAREGVSAGPADPSAILSAVEAMAAPKASAAPTKAAQRRAKRAAEEAERAARIERERAEEGETAGEAEAAQIRAQLERLGLRRVPVQPDGHCLFRAVAVAGGAERVARNGADGGEAGRADEPADAASSDAAVRALRRAAAAYLRPRAAELAPFVLADEEDASPERYEAYCDEVESSAAWGGEPELVALAGALRCTIRVHQAGKEDPLLFKGQGEDDVTDDVIDVVYLHHAFGLGEHYDAALRV